jgi:gliding-associated putative ABC transporter substrate-binding component GldG
MKKKFLLYSSTGVLIFAAIALMVNLISSYVYMRFDLTSGGAYSLSRASKKIMRELPDRVIIKAYFTKDLPQEFSVNRSYVEDLLSEYRTYSRGKVSYTLIDPLEKKDGAQEAQMAGIPPVQFTQIKRDKYEIKEAFMGLLFIYGDIKEIIPVVRSVEGLEYDITNRIKKLLNPGTKTIVMATGHGEVTDFGETDQLLAERYSKEIVDLDKSTSIPEGVSALLITGPRRKYPEEALLAVDQFIMKGVPVALLLDQFAANTQMFYASKIDNGFAAFLAHYGVSILPGFALDPQCERISIRRSQGFFAIENVVAYPFYPLVTDLGRTNAITRALETVGLIFVSPLEIKKKAGFDYETVMRSSRKSWLMGNTRFLNPYQQYAPAPADKKGPLDLAVIITPSDKKGGTLYKSFFAGRKEKKFKNIVRETKNPGRLFIMGNSSFVAREQAFFLNLLDWLSQDEDLISIRSKGSAYRPLKPVSDAARVLVKYSSIFLVPVFVIAYGAWRWNKRKTMKREFRDKYA